MKNSLGLYFPIAEDRIKTDRRLEFFPCRLLTVKNETKTSIIPVKNNGSGDIRASYHTDGFGIHPGENMLLKTGQFIEFYPWKTL